MTDDLTPRELRAREAAILAELAAREPEKTASELAADRFLNQTDRARGAGWVDARAVAK